MKSLLKKAATLLWQLSDRRWRQFYWQRRFQNPQTRTRRANLIASRRVDRVLTPQNDLDSASEALKSEGIVPLGPLLTKAQCAELVDYFATKPVADPYRPTTEPYLPLSGQQHRDSSTAHHAAPDTLQAPYLIDLANDPKILEIVAGFLGCKPLISVLEAWWSYPTQLGPQQAENFHRDVDDWRFVKLFVYLTDVGVSNGPHAFVRWTPGISRLSEIRRYSDAEVFDAFGRQAVSSITGSAGTAFLENTYGLHKGTPVLEGHRLLFQVIYSLHAIPYGPSEPILDAAACNSSMPLDPEINGVYLRAQANREYG